MTFSELQQESTTQTAANSYVLEHKYNRLI